MGIAGDIKITKYQEKDAKIIAQIYYDAIHKVCCKDYAKEQIEVWAPRSCLESNGWIKKWQKLPPLVAIIKDKIVGFAEFENNGHIDCFYVHHQFQNRNIRSKLLEEIEKIAKQKNLSKIYAEVSITAKPFFEKKGFKISKAQTVLIRGVELDNFVMEKRYDNKVIETNNFYLRPFHEKDDFDLSYDLWNDEDVLKSMECPPCTKKDIKEKLARYKLWMDKFGFTNFAVFTKDSDDFVGSCGMSLFHDPDNDRNPLKPINGKKYLNRDVELGYVLHKKYWGKGYATELARACVNFAFRIDYNIKRIVAVTVPNNIASQNVLSKIGFKFEKEIGSKEYGKENFYVVDRAKDAEVILSEYDSGWVQKFEEEKKFLLNIIGDYFCGSVEHVGSTSVPGLIAKPVIDIMFGVKSLSDSKQAIEVLIQNGYNYFPYKKDVMHWFCKPSPEIRTHHLHLVPYESDLWNERIKFRDILRKNTKIADEYVLLKRNLATKYKDDRESYTEGKSSFIKRILNEFN